jgi:hypothetical protein
MPLKSSTTASRMPVSPTSLLHLVRKKMEDISEVSLKTSCEAYHPSIFEEVVTKETSKDLAARGVS